MLLRMVMEAMPRMVMEVMPRMATEDMAWVVMEVMAWAAMEVMVWEALGKAFGLLTASPTTVLNLKAMVSSRPPMASNLNLQTLPRIAKHNSRSNLPNISHPSSLSLPSNPPTSNLVTLDQLPMDMVSSLPTIKELNLPGSLVYCPRYKLCI